MKISSSVNSLKLKQLCVNKNGFSLQLHVPPVSGEVATAQYYTYLVLLLGKWDLPWRSVCLVSPELPSHRYNYYEPLPVELERSIKLCRFFSIST